MKTCFKSIYFFDLAIPKYHIEHFAILAGKKYKWYWKRKLGSDFSCWESLSKSNASKRKHQDSTLIFDSKSCGHRIFWKGKQATCPQSEYYYYNLARSNENLNKQGQEKRERFGIPKNCGGCVNRIWQLTTWGR